MRLRLRGLLASSWLTPRSRRQFLASSRRPSRQFGPSCLLPAAEKVRLTAVEQVLSRRYAAPSGLLLTPEEAKARRLTVLLPKSAPAALLPPRPTARLSEEASTSSSFSEQALQVFLLLVLPFLLPGHAVPARLAVILEVPRPSSSLVRLRAIAGKPSRHTFLVPSKVP